MTHVENATFGLDFWPQTSARLLRGRELLTKSSDTLDNPIPKASTSVMVARDQFGKRFRKRVYDALLDRMAFALVSFAAMRLGKEWLVWNANKYKVISKAFLDNGLGRSPQSYLCQYVPVDVVWVNGSDPLFLHDLKHHEEEIGLDRKPLKSCPFETCVPSNTLTLDRWSPCRFLGNDEAKEESLWRGQNPHLSQSFFSRGPNVGERHSRFLTVGLMMPKPPLRPVTSSSWDWRSLS